MIVRLGNIISDGQVAVRVASDFTAWHSDMHIGEIVGETAAIPACVVRMRERDEAERLAFTPTPTPPVDLSWIPKQRFAHRGPRVPTKRELR